MTSRAVSPLPRTARLYQGRRAGLVTRVVAAAIDSLLVLLGVLFGYGVWAGLLFLLDPRGFHLPELGVVVSGTSMFLVLVAYLTVSWRTSGRTYGSLVMGLRVVNSVGDRLSLPVALVRALLYAALPIGLFWVALNRQRRSIQDLVLRTYVVYDWLPHPPSGSV